jgi:predicted ester cyclase
MSCESDQVRKFYVVIWNAHYKSAIPDIIDEQFEFRGSSGQEKKGHEGFVEYLDMVHCALGVYECSIEEMIADGAKVFARMKFSGTHRGVFLGYEPTGKKVSWDGAALFHFKAGLVSTLWVLGDIKALERQLVSD